MTAPDWPETPAGGHQYCDLQNRQRHQQMRPFLTVVNNLKVKTSAGVLFSNPLVRFHFTFCSGNTIGSEWNSSLGQLSPEQVSPLDEIPLWPPIQAFSPDLISYFVSSRQGLLLFLFYVFRLVSVFCNLYPLLWYVKLRVMCLYLYVMNTVIFQ